MITKYSVATNFLEEFWMILSSSSEVSAVNGNSEVTTFELSEFMRYKVTKIQSFPGVTIKMIFYYQQAHALC